MQNLLNKKNIIILVSIILVIGFIVGFILVRDYNLSKPLNESKIIKSLPTELTENIKKLTITKRETEKKSKDKIWVEIISKNDVAEKTSYYILYYKYANEKWNYENYNDDYTNNWKVIPISGLSKKILDNEIKNQSENGAEVKLVDRKTDLKNKKETLSFDYKYSDDILTSNGTFDVIYVFNDTEWVFGGKTNEKYDNKWSYVGTWEDVGTKSTHRLNLKEENGNITGVYKYTSTIGIGREYTFNYTSGTFSNGNIEMKGQYVFYKDETDDTTFKGIINSKTKEMTISISPSINSGMSLTGTWTLKKVD